MLNSHHRTPKHQTYAERHRSRHAFLELQARLILDAQRLANVWVTYVCLALHVLVQEHVVMAIGLVFNVFEISYARLFSIAVSCALSECAFTTIKLYAQQPRPMWVCPSLLNVHQQWQRGYSFPSGHSMLSATVATSCMLLYQSDDPFPVYAAMYAASLLVGASRVLLGLHFFHDVLLGWLLGCSVSVWWIKGVEPSWLALPDTTQMGVVLALVPVWWTVYLSLWRFGQTSEQDLLAWAQNAHSTMSKEYLEQHQHTLQLDPLNLVTASMVHAVWTGLLLSLSTKSMLVRHYRLLPSSMQFSAYASYGVFLQQSSTWKCVGVRLAGIFVIALVYVLSKRNVRRSVFIGVHYVSFVVALLWCNCFSNLLFRVTGLYRA